MLIKHPGKQLKTLSDENHRLRRELLIARQRISSLSHRLDLAQKELALRKFDITAIPPLPMTEKVLTWIREYNVPWEALYCPDCKSWFIELDNAFPYHQECCVCNCRTD